MILGTAIAKIIASEKSVTAPKLDAEPTTTNEQNINLYKFPDSLERPNKNIQLCKP